MNESKKQKVLNSKGGTNLNQVVPSFLLKTYDIVDDEEIDDIICWNEDGNGFIVK